MKIIRNMRLLDSFKFAIRGITYCINNERNMRIHTVAAMYVLIFSLFFQLSPIKYAVLFLTIALVISSEMMNTAIEELTDMSSENYNAMARISKDVAAGAVFVCALFSIFVGIAIFWQPQAFVNIYLFFIGKPILLIPLILFLLFSFFYIKLGPIGIKELFYRFSKKKRSLF